MRFDLKTEAEYAYKAGFCPDAASFSASSPSGATFHLQNEKGDIPDFLPVVTVSMTNFRYYSSELGRWLSRDPIQEKGGINLYVICRNIVLQSFDVNGLTLPTFLKIFLTQQGIWASIFLGKAINFFTTRHDEICDSLSPGEEYVEMLWVGAAMILRMTEDCLCVPDIYIGPEWWEPGIYIAPIPPPQEA